MDFAKELSLKTKEAEKIIYSYLPDVSGRQKTLLEAMDYGVKVGGKRLRPILVLETLKLFDAEESLAYPFMAAMEFIHTYSLINDDLPAMDNADLRRGKEAVHKKFGEDFGVLAGDGLLNYAYEIAAAFAASQKDADSIKRCAKAFSCLATKAGIYGMVGGQSVDVEEEGKPLGDDTLNFIYKLKTGALLEASMMIGAILGGASDDVITKIESIAGDVGLAFQIQDDILDVTATSHELGKPVNIDDANNKTTYVTVHGVDASKAKVKELSDRAVENLHSLYENTHIIKNDFLEELIYSLINRKK